MRLRITMPALPIVAGAALLLMSTHAHAQLTNGDFNSNLGSGQLTVNTSLTGWTGGGKEGNFGSPTTPPVFLFTAGTATQLSTTGVTGDGFMGTVRFYSVTGAPGGGPVVAADGDPDWAGSIQQNVTGLNVGQTYNLTFNWAGAQQQGFAGDTTEKWQVSFGSDTQSTATVNTPSQTFAGWKTASMSFTPTTSSQVLKFLAVGSPSGEPPWLLLNGVSLSPAAAATPEPGTIAILAGLGLTGAGYLRRRRRK